LGSKELASKLPTEAEKPYEQQGDVMNLKRPKMALIFVALGVPSAGLFAQQNTEVSCRSSVIHASTSSVGIPPVEPSTATAYMQIQVGAQLSATHSKAVGYTSGENLCQTFVGEYVSHDHAIRVQNEILSRGYEAWIVNRGCLICDTDTRTYAVFANLPC
jgi:hypothetical protein